MPSVTVFRGRFFRAGTLVALVTIFIIISSAISAPNAQGAFRGRNGRITATFYESDSEIFSYRPEGGGAKNLTDNSRVDQDSSWSPTGGKIIYSSFVDGNYELFEMKANGTEKHRLTTTPNIAELTAVFNRNAKRIVFFGRVGNEDDYEIFKMRSDGGGLTRLTDNNKDEYGTVWGPDSKHIWFTRDGAGDAEIMVMKADGSHVRQFTHNNHNDAEIDFTPSGNRILVVSARNGNEEIFKMTPKGKHVKRLTNNPGDDDMASWSPEGNRIVFVRNVDGMGKRLMVMSANGSNEHPITDFGDYYRPDWQPR